MEVTGAYRQDFAAKWKMGTPFSITDKGLIFGGIMYSYSQLSPITLISAPANSLLNGSAQVTVDHSTVLQLVYAYNQHQAFLQAMAYANEQINKLSANTQSFKYILQAEDGNKVEVYDSYLVLYYSRSDLMSSFALSQQSMELSRTLTTDEILSVQYCAPDNGLPGSISFLDNILPQPDKKNTVSVSQANAGIAQSIADYLNDCKASGSTTSPSTELPHMDYEPFQGEARTFSLSGVALDIPAEFDALNTYRKQYIKLAIPCAERFKQQYRMYVHDYTTFLSAFPTLYADNMAPMVQYSMDILVAQGIWTITQDAFIAAHKEKFCRGSQDYENLYSAGIKTVENNMVNNAKATNMPRIGRTVTFGSFSDAVGNMVKKEAFNAVADFITEKTVKNTSMNAAQQWELYNRIDLNSLVLRVFCDYSNMWITLCNILIKNGHKLTDHMRPNNESYASLFANLSNPHFPKDKVATALVEMLQASPYNKPYYQFMKQHFGDTEEVATLCDYFGYSDLNNPYTL